MSWAAIGTTVVTLSVTAAANASRKDPKQIDYGAATAAGIKGDLANLPALRQMEIASRLGSKVQTTTGEQVPVYGPTVTINIPAGPVYRAGTGQQGGFSPARTITILKGDLGKYPGAEITGNGSQIIGYQNKKISADFTGIGDADLQAKMARNNAQTGLDISREFAPQYIAEAKRQQALADPQGTEARKLLYQRTQDEINRVPDRPVSTLLDSQITSSLNDQNKLSGDSSDLVRKALAARVGMGDAPTSDIVGRLESGPEGDARSAMRRSQALGYISSGAAPTDVAYRKSQQDMSSLGSFLRGETPTAQFQQLSGAQQGAAPISRAPTAVNANPNAGAQGAQNTLSQSGQQFTQASQTPNPWFTGLGLAIKGAAAYNNGRQGTGFG